MIADLELSGAQLLLSRAIADTPSEARFSAARQLWQGLGDESSFVLARANDVIPILAHTFLDALGPDNVPAHWRRAHEETYNRTSVYLAELDRMADLLADQGILLIALKNGGIARGLYPCPGCCPMGDLDVLVEKRHFRQAHQVLLTEGYHFEFRSPLEEADLEAAEKGGGAEYWKILPNGEKLWFELQWRPVAGHWIHPDQEPSAEELMARSVPIPGTAVRLLAPEDNLLQVALHTAKHSYVRAPGFRLHLDVDRMVRHVPIDWELFVQRARRLRVRTAVYFSLAIPNALFGTPIPDEVLQVLRPPGWKERLITRWLNRVGLFNPDERKFSRPGYILFMALLYDDLGGLRRSVFPYRAWMRSHYERTNDVFLLYDYFRRLVDLLVKCNGP